MTLGALALTGNSGKRAGAGVPLNNVMHMSYCDYLGTDNDTIDVIRRYLEDSSSGMDHPAAIILETVQAEGGVNVASGDWLKKLAGLAEEFGVLLIVDDIQVGCGRTGPFFSFEAHGIKPDIICLSKSLSGYGLPLSVTLMKPELDEFTPGEHNGTFRGHNPAFVTATAALNEYWKTDDLTQAVKAKAKIARNVLLDLAEEFDGEVRGNGLIQGIEFADPAIASAVSRAAFERGLIIETAGTQDQLVKLLPPLTIEVEQLQRGLGILRESIQAVISHRVSGVEQTVN
jgi:diaminobutyrate-2-oxoglutarate transaminase